jgi:hypothetical protein
MEAELPSDLPAYAELHCLSNFTFLRGASHAEELVERAHALGYAALAITDECSLAGVVRAHVAAKEWALPATRAARGRPGPSAHCRGMPDTGAWRLLLQESSSPFTASPQATDVRDQPHAQASCSPAFRLALALAMAACVAACSWLWAGGFDDTTAVLRTAAIAAVAAVLAYRLAEHFLLVFAVSMAPVLVLLALLSHWLP